MARVKKGVNAHKRHKKVLKMAKGYYGAKSKTFRAAKPATMRALRSAYVGRKNKKRDYRKLWIARINAAARMNDISYSRLIDGLKEVQHRHQQKDAVRAGYPRSCSIHTAVRRNC